MKDVTCSKFFAFRGVVLLKTAPPLQRNVFACWSAGRMAQLFVINTIFSIAIKTVLWWAWRPVCPTSTPWDNYFSGGVPMDSCPRSVTYIPPVPGVHHGCYEYPATSTKPRGWVTPSRPEWSVGANSVSEHGGAFELGIPLEGFVPGSYVVGVRSSRERPDRKELVTCRWDIDVHNARYITARGIFLAEGVTYSTPKRSLTPQGRALLIRRTEESQLIFAIMDGDDVTWLPFLNGVAPIIWYGYAVATACIRYDTGVLP